MTNIKRPTELIVSPRNSGGFKNINRGGVASKVESKWRVKESPIATLSTKPMLI